jgi:hypothetical protein
MAALPAPDPTRARTWSAARPTEYAGVLYASKAEARRAEVLEMLRRAGKIESWCRARRYPLNVEGELCGHYTPDFLVTYLDGSQELLEVKGRAARDVAFRLNVFRALYPEIPLRVIDGDGNPWKAPRRKRGQVPAALLRRARRNGLVRS